MKDSIILRKDVPTKNQWDLSKLYASSADWQVELESIPNLVQNVVQFKGILGKDKETFLKALKAWEKANFTLETVYHYASLLNSVDKGDSSAQEKVNRALMEVTNLESSLSFFDPEILALPTERVTEWLKDDSFADYRVFIQKKLHLKPYTLSEKEERILALNIEASQTADNVFNILTDVDLNFGTVRVDEKDVPLTHISYSSFIENPNREIRKEAYTKFYGTFESHANTLAALYSGSVNNDIFLSRARGYGSSLEAALYADKVPVSVYTNLIQTIHKNFEPLHRYYSLRKKVLGLNELRHYDVYVPLVKSIKTHHTYEEAVEIVRAALAVLGKEYTDTLCDGLLNGWADRFENKGKHSGAFSSGAYKGYPYILLNYKEDSIRDVFTMAHEGGHSMHSWYSTKNNPFSCYEYTIFEAETASTFNEELVFEYLLKEAKSNGNKEMELYLLATRAHEILSTLYRQTMFAEFELKAHEKVEQGEPLSTEVLRAMYRSLLEQYFGPEMVFEENSDLEGLRIPHFYSAFYVYKYSTGISASLALAKRVTTGGKAELEDYYTFLKSGGSRYPIESLKVAGGNMEESKPVQDACDTFADLVGQLEKALL